MRINMVIVSDDNANVCVRPQSHWQKHNTTNTNQPFTLWAVGEVLRVWHKQQRENICLHIKSCTCRKAQLLIWRRTFLVFHRGYCRLCVGKSLQTSRHLPCKLRAAGQSTSIQSTHEFLNLTDFTQWLLATFSNHLLTSRGICIFLWWL